MPEQPRKPIPEDIERILRKPGKDWTRTGDSDGEKAEIDRVIEWLLQEKLPGLVRFAYSILIVYNPRATRDDALAAAVEKIEDAWRYIETFDPTAASFLRWLYVILRKHCSRQARTSAAQHHWLANPAPAPPVVGPDQSELITRVRQWIDDLPEPYCTALRMALDGAAMEGIAGALGKTISHVKVLIHRARQILKALRDERITHLPEPYREALILRHYRGMSYAEIVPQQGCSVDEAKARVHRAQLMLLERHP